MRGLIRLLIVGAFALLGAILILSVLLTMARGLGLVTSGVYEGFMGTIRGTSFYLFRTPLALPGAVNVAVVIGAIILVVLAIRLTKRDESRNARTLDEDETRLVRELHEGIARLEERVESLETILLDRARRPRKRPDAKGTR